MYNPPRFLFSSWWWVWNDFILDGVAGMIKCGNVDVMKINCGNMKMILFIFNGILSVGKLIWPLNPKGSVYVWETTIWDILTKIN